MRPSAKGAPQSEHFALNITRMNGIPLAKMKVHSLQTVGELIMAIKTAARADDLEMMLAFNAEVLQPAMTLEDAKLSDGCTVVAIRYPELFLAATYDDGLTKIWSAETGSCERTIEGCSSVVTGVAFAASGLSLVLGMMDGHVQLRSVTSGEIMREFRAHHAPISGVACSANGQLLATGSLDRTAIVWDFDTGRATKVFSGHSGSVTSLAFSSDSKTLGTGSEDCTVRLWKVLEKKPETILKGHAGCIKTLSFSQHAKGLASGSSVGEVMIWSPLGKLELNLKPCGFAVCAVSYSPDGMSLAVGGTEGQCRIYSIGTGVCILSIECNNGPGSIRSVAFSPAGTLLATGAEDGNMSVFGIADGNCKLAMPAHVPEGSDRPVGVFAVAFSPGPTSVSQIGKVGDVFNYPHYDI
ncbi:unnamed protein product [Durusdinium trenchii]|uniref:Uncharacterized protein n=1 Tax=Durusdinium trenchii TaxID=1381693 RepID=A0ABP0L4R0_9DINO